MTTNTTDDGTLGAKKLAYELDRLGDMELQAHDIALWVESRYSDLLAALREVETLRAQVREREREIRGLRGAPDPRAFDLSTWGEWLRLLRETRGYMHACWRQHDGGDRKGRFYAEDALKEMEARLEQYALTPQPAPTEGGRE